MNNTCINQILTNRAKNFHSFHLYMKLNARGIENLGILGMPVKAWADETLTICVFVVDLTRMMKISEVWLIRKTIWLECAAWWPFSSPSLRTMPIETNHPLQLVVNSVIRQFVPRIVCHTHTHTHTENRMRDIVLKRNRISWSVGFSSKLHRQTLPCLCLFPCVNYLLYPSRVWHTVSRMHLFRWRNNSAHKN